MKIAISSGKGGTGKTFVATNLAVVAADQGRGVTYLDCDVEAPNAHLFLAPEVTKEEHRTVRRPVEFDEARCTACGACVEACQYNALTLINDKVLFFPELCHACGACAVSCPTGAVVEGDAPIGLLKHGKSGSIDFHYALLETAAGGMSPRLIQGLKEWAGPGITLLDSPPGTACPVVETVHDADLCLLVTDPTPFSLHDLKLSVNMCRQLGQEPAVIVNRAGIDDQALRAYCREMDLELVGEIPDARAIAEAYSDGKLVAQALPEYREPFEALLARALELAAEPRPVREDLIRPLFENGDNPARAARPEPMAARPEEIVIVSGKGGTGKTSIAACFAQLNEGAPVADCDVDAADLHLILKPQTLEEGDFVGGRAMTLDEEKCGRCGLCEQVCRFNAITRTESLACRIDPHRCEGCGACEIVCPLDAISSEDSVNGRWFQSNTRFGPMAHAMLGIAEENSGRLVTLVRDLAMGLAAKSARKAPLLIDGSPGTGCPVIASITGARYAVVVSEPTVSGLHDCQRILDLTKHFGIRTGVIVNKADLNPGMAERVVALARDAGADVLGDLPYDKRFVAAQVQGQTLLEYADSPTGAKLRELWRQICILALPEALAAPANASQAQGPVQE